MHLNYIKCTYKVKKNSKLLDLYCYNIDIYILCLTKEYLYSYMAL